jgi:hypothetical protein
MRKVKGYLTNIPLVALVAANMVPLWGVLFFNWDAFYIVLLYWAENLVIGSYNILKMLLAQPLNPDEPKKLTDERGKEHSLWATGVLYHVSKLLYMPFFAFHYGAFAAAHGFFVLMMFGKGDAGFGQIIQDDQVSPCLLVFIQLLFLVVKHAYSTILINMKYALAALFVSHGISFVYNYLYHGEYKAARLDTLMGQPYARVVVLHIAIIAGAFVSGAMGSPVGVLVMLVVIKIIIDIKLHLRQHRKKQSLH